jgi:hypothetical protein
MQSPCCFLMSTVLVTAAEISQSTWGLATDWLVRDSKPVGKKLP